MMKRQEGFSLIELLVAVVIMAVGILGIAGLQVVALQQNRSALLRAEATMLANDIMDRIRVNTDITYGTLIDAAPADPVNCKNTECNRAEMADYDIAVWKCSINHLDADGNTHAACTTLGINGKLPEGAGAINKAGDIYTVTVQWSDDRGDNTQSVVIRSQVN
ncbi:MAG: type IV pilus modification protein PilV [Pseudomonadales bacterium]|nr:type IV pilus modification protein PilV [Pseudomonadales bacterium]